MKTKKGYVTITIHGHIIKIDRETDNELKNKKLHVAFNPGAKIDWEYAWVFHDALNIPNEPLHLFVWRFFMNEKRPLREGEILHHRNEDKNDARLSNLGPGTPALHAKVHALKRQKFTPRKRVHLGSLFKPHAPAEAKDITGPAKDEMQKGLLERQRLEREEQAKKDAWVAKHVPSIGTAPPPSDPETVLTEDYYRLRPIIARLDSGMKIPPPESRPRQSDRLFGIGRIRLGCTYGEVGLVYSLIDQGFDINAVVHDVKLPRDVIETMMKEPAVSRAIENWHLYKRLPKPSTMKKLAFWATGLKKRWERKRG